MTFCAWYGKRQSEKREGKQNEGQESHARGRDQATGWDVDATSQPYTAGEGVRGLGPLSSMTCAVGHAYYEGQTSARVSIRTPVVNVCSVVCTIAYLRTAAGNGPKPVGLSPSLFDCNTV